MHQPNADFLISIKHYGVAWLTDDPSVLRGVPGVLAEVLDAGKLSATLLTVGRLVGKPPEIPPVGEFVPVGDSPPPPPPPPPPAVAAVSLILPPTTALNATSALPLPAAATAV